MGIAFDHSQYMTDIRMALGEDSESITHAAPFTEREFLRSLVDPGFSGSIRFLEADLYFEGGVSVIQNVTWKWQARELGGTTWVDLHAAVNEQWTGGTSTGLRVGIEALSLTSDADAVPLEMRLLVSAAIAADISVRIGGASPIPAVRVFGESV
jgi:hypothetical protein